MGSITSLPKETDKPLFFCATAVETKSTLCCLQFPICVNKNELFQAIILWGLFLFYVETL